MKRVDISGKVFNRLTVISRADKDIHGRSKWHCLCDCGSETIVRSCNLSSGHTKSCGCFHREATTKHGYGYHKLYEVWRHMVDRCYNKSSNRYYRYGSRGISVCDEWKNDVGLFVRWLEKNGYKKGISNIDRINNNKGYYPGNCRVINKELNAKNKCNSVYVVFKGVKMLLIDLADRFNIKRCTLRARILKYGMSVEDAVTHKKYSTSRGHAIGS